MGKSPLLVVFVMVVLLLAACEGAINEPQGPRLVLEVTLPPSTYAPTRVLSLTPEALPEVTSELVSPLDMITLEANYVLVTPTLPPSKTPTLTPTITPTPSLTPTPTETVTATATAPLFPTSIILPVTAVVANPLPQVCDSTWFFIQPRPPSCPLNAPSASQGVFQMFQNGFMIWVGQVDAIYVLYHDQSQPRWQVFKDFFDEGMPEDDPAYAIAPSAGLWQPRRGFGMLWRSNAAVRQRIGWGTEQWERPYSVMVQTGSDGTLFVNDPNGGIFAIVAGGSNWQFFSGGF